MPTLQTEYITILGAYARLFSKRIWEHARILLIGAVLSPAERTVTAVLRVMGLSWEKHFQNYHRVLNRAVWSSVEASRILLGLLIIVLATWFIRLIFWDFSQKFRSGDCPFPPRWAWFIL